MKTIHIAAALGACAWAAGLAATGAAAAPADDTQGRKVEHVERFVLVDHKGQGESGDPHVLAVALADGGASCTGNADQVSQQSEDGKQKTKIVICSPGEASPADRAERLQRAIARVEANQELSAEHKEKVVAALREAIERLQATH
ncbi:MAG: hypothetical protein ACJ8DZ_00435 [Allosphingosinicella sp.]